MGLNGDGASGSARESTVFKLVLFGDQCSCLGRLGLLRNRLGARHGNGFIHRRDFIMFQIQAVRPLL